MRRSPVSLLLVLGLATAASLVAGCPETKKGNATPAPSGTISVNGGTLDDLVFAVVGDTRPQVIDDTAAYPTLIITTIFQALQGANPRPAFAVSTGDYMFASNTGNQAAPQLDKYLDARKKFSNPVFPVMGNHECTGYTSSNCGPGTADGLTNQYQTFVSKFLTPLGLSEPYYSVHIDATDGSWTAKFVFIAANAWTNDQATWLESTLSQPTTYTFVLRHEDVGSTTAPGVTPSANIIGAHPYTLLIVGHSHTYYHSAANKEAVVGNGGAPITSSVKYGYVIGHRRTDGAIQFDSREYDTGNVVDSFALNPDGTAAP